MLNPFRNEKPREADLCMGDASWHWGAGWGAGACSPRDGPLPPQRQGETASPQAGDASAQLTRHRLPHSSIDF